jgi:pimeloyl-ACP methyl ester carboxylesterase
MGGMLAARYALTFPDEVERLVLLDPIGLEDYVAAGVPYRTPDEAYAAELQATPDSLRAYQKKSYFGGEWKPEFEALLEPQIGWMKNPDRPRVAWCAALTTSMILEQPVVQDLPRLRVPTLLVVGSKDRAAVGGAWAPKAAAEKLGDVPTLARKAAGAIPGARLVEMPGVGHLPHVEAFDAWMRELTEFLGAASK